MDFEIILNNLEREADEYKENLILGISDIILSILYQPKYSLEDKKIIQEYVTSGMYEKSIKYGLKNSKIRNILIDIKNYYKEELKRKAPEFENFYKRKEMSKIMSDAYSEILLDNNEVHELDVNTHAYILQDLLYKVIECGLENTFDFVYLYKKRISIEGFKKSPVFDVLSYGLHAANLEKDSDYKREKLINYYDFAQVYLSDCIVADSTIDFENDKLLKEFPPEQLYTLKGFTTLLDIDKQPVLDSTEMLNQINAYIAKLLKRFFEIRDYKLTSEERYALESYFTSSYKFLKNNIEKYSELDQTYVDEIFEYLYKIERYSLDYDKDTIPIKDIYAEDLINYYESLSKIAIKNSNDLQVLIFWKTNCDETVIKEYLKSLNVAGKDPYKSKAMETYIEEFIENIALKKRHNYFDGFDFDLLKKYFNNIIEKDNFNIFDEQYISDILQLIYTNSFLYGIERELKKSLEEKCHILKIDIESEKKYLLEFVNDIQNQVITDENKMDDFVRHLGNLKLANYRILNQSLIDFVLKQSLLENSAVSNNPEKYRGLIERCLEDLGRNDLPLKICQNNYVYFIRDFISKDPYIIGLNCYKSRIYLKRSIVNDLLYHRSYEALETVFHENTHSVQDYDIDNSDYNNYYKYLMTKEQIIRNYNPDFYNANYKLMFMEIDARIGGFTKLLAFLKRIEPINTMQLVTNDLKNTILSSISKRRNEYQNLQIGKFKRKSQENDELFKVEDLFDEIILQYPGYLRKYPKLEVEYNKDGTLKRIDQILADIDSIFDPYMIILDDDSAIREINELNMDRGLFYLKVLKNGNCLKPENLPEDLRTIMNYEIRNEETIYIVAFLIFQNIPRLLKSFSKIPIEKRKELYYEINNVLEHIEEIREKPEADLTYSEKALLKGFTKTNRQSLESALSMLQLTQEKIKFFGVDLTPVSEESQKKVKVSPKASKPSGTGILARSYYETTEEDRENLMKELVEMGYKNYPTSKDENSDKEEKDISRM